MQNAQSVIFDELHHLAESVVELQWVMELLVSFMDEDIFVATVPSNWVETSSPMLAEAARPAQGGPCQ